MQLLKKLVAIPLIYWMFNIAHADEIRVAVATNFTAAMKEIVAQFEKNSGHEVIVSFGSSGKIFAQIQHGAPFQIFLSADQTKPEMLEQAALTVPGSRFTYAIGGLVLWSSKPDSAGIESALNYNRLKNGEFNKLALANPKLAPYGAAAVEVLEALKLKQFTQAKWVQGENISQAYQYVATGNADLGFVALAQIMDKGHIKGGSSWVIPDELYTPIRQDAVLLRSAKDSVGAKVFLDYLCSDEAQAIIYAYGYKAEKPL